MPNLALNRTITRFYNSYSMIFGRKTSSSEADEQWKGEKCLNTMHQSFHRSLTTCRAPLPPGKKYVAVQFLTKELIFYVIDAKGKGQEVFDEASKHLGLLDSELFGLAFYQDGDYIFIDLNLKVSKYAVRSWKTNTNGIGGDGQPLLVLHMRIKYYVDCHLLINEKVVRHHYYLQLRENVKNYMQPLSEEKSFLLAALALQADLGNFNEEKHRNRYFEIYNYFPACIVKKIGEEFIIRNVPALHKDNVGLSRGEAQVGYIKEASDISAPHNLHFYKLRRKKGKFWGNIWLGIADNGIHIYEDVKNTKSLLSTFTWCDIAKLHFEKKKFEILSEGSPEYRRFTYFVQNEDLAKHLLWICRMTHHFHMANQSRVAELKKLELDGGKPYRESYIYTDVFDQAREKKQNTLQKSKLMKSKVENCMINFNGTGHDSTVEKSLKPVNMKMSGWNNSNCFENGQNVSSHHSMEVLPLTNGCKFSSDIKYKSQSIPCLPDRSLTPFPNSVDSSSSSQLWCPTSNSEYTTPTSTLMSRSSCTSNTDSTCSSLSLTSSSTLKVGSTLRCSNDSNRWVKCDSFEELPLKASPKKKVQKVCISTFIDKHVQTANVYDAIIQKSENSQNVQYSTNAQESITYATSSLEAPSSNKLIDVKRSPSFNVSLPQQPQQYPVFSNLLQKPYRQYTTNCQQSHGRTATRIGVSSLSREQRLPLSLYDERRILACGSEPNLYAPLNDHSHLENAVLSLKTRWLQRNFNSHSEMCLNVLENHSQNGVKPDSRSRQLSLPDVCNEMAEVEADFPCIPPPPAYRNEVVNGFVVPEASFHSHSQVLPTASKDKLKNPSATFVHNSEKDKDIPSGQSSPTDILDIHQLRQRSRDLDLPLISALCNDRSLLMLPKTVPTCSRQRHLGNSDRTRFNRTTSLPNGDGLDALLINSVRPISWHVDSSQVPHWSEVSKPCSSSWDYGIRTHPPVLEGVPKPRTCSVDSGIRTHMPLNDIIGKRVPTVSLPPTILTSFVKTPLKQTRSVRDQISASDSYRYDKNQMIPIKLLAGSLGSIPNGRLYQKGLSS